MQVDTLLPTRASSYVWFTQLGPTYRRFGCTIRVNVGGRALLRDHLWQNQELADLAVMAAVLAAMAAARGEGGRAAKTRQRRARARA